MDTESLKCFVISWAVTAIILIVSSAFLLPKSFFANTVTGGTKETAKEALTLTKDWVTWMAGIQTATIAALGLVAKEGLHALNPSQFQLELASLVALFNTLALFFSAWLLTSLSSLMLRFYKDRDNYDFFNAPLYAFMEGNDKLKDTVTVGYIAFWNHWLWAIGLVCFGLLSISLLISPVAADKTKATATIAPSSNQSPVPQQNAMDGKWNC